MTQVKEAGVGDTEENAPSGVDWPVNYSWVFEFCIPFAGFMKFLQQLQIFSTHQCFAVVMFLLSVTEVSKLFYDSMWIRKEKSIS